jgi:hypothetical protein
MMSYKASYLREIKKTYELRQEIQRLRGIIAKLVSCGEESE